MRVQLSVLAVLAAVGLGGQVGGSDMKTALVDHTAFSGSDCPWRPEAARDEIRPECEVDAKVSRVGKDGSLRIRCRDAVQYGGWALTADDVEPGSWYRFDAHYRARRVAHERRTVVARLDWRKREGGRAGQPDYVYRIEDAGDGWKHVWTVAPAPEGAAGVELELLFGWSPGGTVWWDDVSLHRVDPPAPRRVKVATIRHQPRGNKTAQANIEEFCAWIDRVAEQNPDIICLPEAMTMAGTGLSYADVAEPIPGPTSRRLGQMAKKHGCYLVACYNERDGHGVYNTAVLIDRDGQIVGKYRKAYVPREEIEGGVTPGDEYPVFDTDFGKVGMMICWDVQYVGSAQIMALKGAEIIFLPIWGGNETLMKARAIENHVFLVSCGYGARSWIIAPDGEVLAEAAEQGEGNSQIAVAEIDLNRRYLDPWLGDMRARFFKEHRDDLR